MKSLYWKIFLAFWAVIAVAVLITATVNRIVFDDNLASARLSSLQKEMHSLHHDAAASLSRGGEPALRDWLDDHARNNPGPPIYVIDGRGEDLLGRPLPPRLRRHLAVTARNPEQGDSWHHRAGPAELVATNGEHYRIVLPPFRPRLGPWSMRPQSRAVFPVILLLVSGLVCFLLARYLTSPIRELSATGRQIANGDLGARVGGGVAKRGDEFGTLARDFDLMAERIQALLDSRDRLLRDVSHELRSPLTRLKIASALLRNKTGPEGSADIDRIEREADSLNALIGQILAYSRIQSQDIKTKGPTDLDAVLSGVVEDACFEGRARGIAVDYEAAELPLVIGNERMLNSALENVVRNALNHARERVEVRATHGKDMIHIVVSDDGAGAAEADLPLIFEPFFTGTRNESESGAGIGLAIARRAVELHGGSISARNGCRGGFEVEIEIPVGHA
jgi:signal transduction histidine kinase